MMKSLLDDDPVLDRYPLPGNQEDESRERHDSQPPELKQEEDDNLSERSEICGCILDDKTGHTDAGSRREHGVHHRNMT